jgi:hypothetical protein
MQELPGGIEIRIRCKAADYPSEAAQEEALTYTLNGIMGLEHAHSVTGQMLHGMIQAVGSKINFTSVAHDPHIQQATLADGD